MKKSLFLAVLLVFVYAGCKSWNRSNDTAGKLPSEGQSTQVQVDDDDADDDDDEVDVALDQVPQSIKDAGIAAVPGLTLTGAEKETEDGTVIYCLEGKVNGESCEVEVTTDGKVLEIERGEDDD